MRLVSFERHGTRSFGVADAAGPIADVGAVLARRFADLESVLAAGALDIVEDARRRAPLLDPESVALLPPVAGPVRIFCVGVNYRDHRAEMRRLDPGRAEAGHPTIFVRFASSLVGHASPVERPLASEAFDYEGELAVVVGRAGRRLDPVTALAHVAGYSCFLDGTVRDYQRHTSQYTAGKNFDRSGAFGPALVTADEVGDPSRLRLRTLVNGEVLQEAATDQMVHGVGELLTYLSTFTELRPGDVVATGTPGGVGAARQPPRWLVPGDVVEVEVAGVGTLANPVVAEAAAGRPVRRRAR